MKNQIRIALGGLASADYQRRFCIQGTKSEYVLPDELLESAANTVETILSSAVLTRNLASFELEALRTFLGVARGSALKIPFHNASVSNEELIENNPEWNLLRTAAQECLDALGLKIGLEELLRRSDAKGNK